MTSLLLIGAAGLDWAGFAAQARAGTLPALAGLARRGGAVPMNAFPVDEGPAPWATLASGRPPEAHGVHAREEPWAGGLRPIGQASWRAPPVWARLEAAGVSTGSAGWPATRPGDAWPGLHVDDRFAPPTGFTREDWALPPGATPPGEAREALRARRVHPADVDAGMLAPLVPQLASIDQSRDADLPRLALAMAEAATLQGAAAWLLEDDAPSAVFVHHPCLARVRARFDGVREGPFAPAVDGAWRFLDALVGRLAELAGPDATVVVASPGWRRRSGVFLVATPGARLASDLLGVDPLDVAPTALAVFGLEDRDAPGAARLPAGPSPRPAPTPPAPPAVTADADLLAEAQRAGFAPPRPPSPRWRADVLTNLARLMLARAPEEARALAAEALELQPEHLGALQVLATALAALETPEPLAAVADALERLAPARGWGALARGACHALRGETDMAVAPLARAERDPDPETRLRVAAVWLSAGRMDRAERVFAGLLAVDPANASAEVGLAMGALARRDFAAAEAALGRALRLEPNGAAAYLQFARLRALTGRRTEAERMAQTAVRLGAAPTYAAVAADGD